ncbi:MAG: DJ-1/PfpI family protein [Patescibacteria group bacterium]
MAKILLIVANDGFNEDEYFITKEILESNSIQVVTGALEAGGASGTNGRSTNVDVVVSDLLEYTENVEEYDGVVFVGGSSMAQITDDERFYKLAINFNQYHKLISAICIAPVILAKANLLRGKKATVFADEQAINDLVANGAEYTDQEVIIDGDIITANGPKAAYKFGSAIVKALLNKD